MEATKARLDMDHGFFQSIRKNQIDRDIYDKEMKATKNQKQYRPSQGTNKFRKPDQVTYVPPTVRNSDHSASADSPENTTLFRLEYEEEDRRVTNLVIKEGDDAAALAEEFGKSRSFTQEMVVAFAEFLNGHIQRVQQASTHKTDKS